ncbi:hypothetical protein K0M31_016481 [Melipona bicolor]|uniref:Uncharacterized protein n=1 Tax=Melipona bicolor TaxID=60889 RepID=A0AA40KTI7_9HYME|nr:hypothetical protein K0M31_016481 [Melipona bicolor]
MAVAEISLVLLTLKRDAMETSLETMTTGFSLKSIPFRDVTQRRKGGKSQWKFARGGNPWKAICPSGKEDSSGRRSRRWRWSARRPRWVPEGYARRTSREAWSPRLGAGGVGGGSWWTMQEGEEEEEEEAKRRRSRRRRRRSSARGDGKGCIYPATVYTGATEDGPRWKSAAFRGTGQENWLTTFRTGVELPIPGLPPVPGPPPEALFTDIYAGRA